MKYNRFEDLPVWQKAMDLASGTFTLTKAAPFRGHSGLRDQIERAAVSVSNNIAEGFERGTTPELLAFLYIARGSAGETRSMLCLMERMPEFHPLNQQLDELKAIAESCARQIRGWADSLQESDIKGQRHLTVKTKAQYQNRKGRDEFLKTLNSFRPPLPGADGEKSATQKPEGD
jgi:four helix bundle protein